MLIGRVEVDVEHRNGSEERKGSWAGPTQDHDMPAKQELFLQYSCGRLRDDDLLWILCAEILYDAV